MHSPIGLAVAGHAIELLAKAMPAGERGQQEDARTDDADDRTIEGLADALIDESRRLLAALWLVGRDLARAAGRLELDQFRAAAAVLALGQAHAVLCALLAADPRVQQVIDGTIAWRDMPPDLNRLVYNALDALSERLDAVLLGDDSDAGEAGRGGQ